MIEVTPQTNYTCGLMGIYQQEHLIFQQSVRKFAEKEIFPFVDEWEDACHFPSDIFLKLGNQGFLGILIDEAWGGVGGDYLLAGAWCEEFGRIPSVGFTTGVNMHALVVTPAVARYGTPEIKERWLRRAVDGSAIGAYAFTEPGAGSDLSQLQTKAVPDGDHFVINGSKIFITNGARAQFVLVLTKTNPSKGYNGYSTFLVDTSLPGFKVAGTLSKLGWHASDTAELVFENVRVHRSALLGELNSGWQQAMSSLEWERLMLTLAALGGASRCLESTFNYVNERKIFGQAVAQFDHTRETLALLWSKLETGRAFCHQCLQLLLSGKRCRKEISLAKIYICELAIHVADRCVQLHGGYGYTTEFVAERWLRDLRLNTIGGGTSEVMAGVVAKELMRD